MGDVGREAEPLVDPADELVGRLQRHLADPSASPTDDVHVGGVLGEVVARGAVVDVGEAISVGTHRDRSGEGDPVMDEVRRSLQSMIDAMAAERTPI